jgi:hypothetical protein
MTGEFGLDQHFARLPAATRPARNLHDGLRQPFGARDPDSERIDVVIDTRMAECNKYKYDEALGHLRLSRVLPVGMSREFKLDGGLGQLGTGAAARRHPRIHSRQGHQSDGDRAAAV